MYLFSIYCVQTGNKEREDRIAELEEFINDQVTELDKMEAALKQTVANNEILKKEFDEVNVRTEILDCFCTGSYCLCICMQSSLNYECFVLKIHFVQSYV